MFTLNTDAIAACSWICIWSWLNWIMSRVHFEVVWSKQHLLLST